MNQPTLLLHQLLHEMKLCTQYFMNARIPKLLPVRFWISGLHCGSGRFSSYLVCSVASPQSDGCISNCAKWRIQFSNVKMSLPGQATSWAVVELAWPHPPTLPAAMTSPNSASPQSKHCNPLISSHSRISLLLPPEYGGNLHRPVG